MGQNPLQPPLEGTGQPQQKGGGEGGDHRHGHNHRVEEGPRHRQGLPQAGQNEGELPHLGLGRRRRQADPQGLPRRQAPQGEEEELADNGRPREQQNGPDILGDHGRLDHKAHGDEKDRPEEMLAGGHQMLHPLGMDRARQQGAGQKGPQLRGQADLLGQQGHEEAQPQGEDQQHLVVHQPHQLFHQGGHQVNPQNQPQGQGEDQQADPLGQGPAADGLGDGDGGQDHHGEDGKQVLNDQGAHGQAGKLLLLHPQIFHVLHGNHGGGHGQHDPQKEAVHGAPAQGQAQQDPHAPHARRLDAGG